MRERVSHQDLCESTRPIKIFDNTVEDYINMNKDVL